MTQIMMHQYRWKQLCQLGNKLAKDQKGAAILVAIIVIAAVLLAISLSLGLSSISENQINLYQSKSSRILLNIDGCAEEALARLNSDNSYTGETMMLDDTSCTITVAGSASTRTITVEATNTNYTKNLQINVTITPTFAITSWAETTN